jgi:hypothetical protein
VNSTYKLAVTKRDAMAGRDASTSGSAGENKAELIGAKYDSFKTKTKSVRKNVTRRGGMANTMCSISKI